MTEPEFGFTPLPPTENVDRAQQLERLRVEFPRAKVGMLPKQTCKTCSKNNCDKHQKSRCNDCGAWVGQHIHIDYVGHAEVTDRLLSVDPFWTWEPVAWDPETGGPRIAQRGSDLEMWIKVTIAGVTRPGVGTVAQNAFEVSKQLISDAIRNASMRFGVALDLWAKSDLHDAEYRDPLASEYMVETIDETQTQKIRDLWSTIEDHDTRVYESAQWQTKLGHDVSFTPKLKFLDVYNSAAARVKELTDTPDDGVSQEAEQAAKSVSKQDLIEWSIRNELAEVPSGGKKDEYLLSLSVASGQMPSVITGEILDWDPKA
jgi:hypothetical protein